MHCCRLIHSFLYAVVMVWLPVIQLLKLLFRVFVKYWNNLHDKAYTVLDEGSYNEFYAVGFRKQDQSLRDTINSVLNQLKRDGKFVELSVKWFGK